MVMNKSQLTNFITKYTLGGEIKSTKWTSNGSSLSTRFISGDKSVVGSVVLSKFNHLSPCELGVYNTGQLSSLLSVLGDDVEVSLSQSGDKFISMEFEDTNRKTKSKYMLSDLSVIPTPPALKNLPDSFELGIKVDPYFVNTFISGKGALSEAETFTILTENGETKIVIGYASIASNRVTIPVETTKQADIEPISFNANMFASILNANKDCESATLEVSSAGLSRIKFSIDNYDSEYFLVSTQAVN
jgi:ribosome maturation factor RimP